MELPSLKEEFDRYLAEQKQPAVWERFPPRSLAWLALVPFWPREVARKGFPSWQSSVTGEEADRLLNSLAEAGILEFVSRDSAESDLVYTANSSRRAALLKGLVETFQLDFLRGEAAEAAAALRAAAADGYPLDPPLERWAELASVLRPGSPDSAGSADEPAARILLERVTAGIDKARQQTDKAGQQTQLAAPLAALWVSTAGPMADLFGGPLQIALTQAYRQIELYHRRAYDARYLENYLPRPTAEDAFHALISATDYWALHFVGLGGTGKTMLMRQFTRLESDLNIATTRVDFDNLNPEYPSRAPGLLLKAFAEELRYQGGVDAANLFTTFDYQVQRVHDRIEAAYRDGVPAEISVKNPDFREVIESFVWALREAAGPRTPVLILDTCEELAKVRSDRPPAENVQVTFELLDLIHQADPRVRVVFSGRRPLAQAGFGWRCPASSLPKRDHLALFEVSGFTAEEATECLRRYSRNGRRVNLSLTRKILDLSRSSDDASDSRFEFNEAPRPAGTELYNPFDVDMFASWSCENPALDEDLLEHGGVHHYVQERIVDRIHGPMSRLLPVLALLGRFDEDLMRELVREYEPVQTERLLEEVKSQEWIDLDRGGGPKDWMLDQAMRARLRRYYRERRPQARVEALDLLGRKLSRLILERSWKDLKAEYFDLVLTALKSNPPDAARWWAAVENKISSDGAWKWCYPMLELVLGDDGAVQRTDAAPGMDPASENPLRAAVLATYAAVLTHLEGRQPREAWEEALSKAGRHPANAAALEWRARAGLFASTLRDPEIPLSDQTLSACRAFIDAGPFSGEEQMRASLLSVLEAFTEALERSDRAGEYLRDCPQIAGMDSPGVEFYRFYRSLRGRLQTLAGNSDEARADFDAALRTSPPGFPALQRWLDWEPPADLSARIRLELVRALYPAEMSADDILKRLGDEPATLANLDQERLASIIALLRVAVGRLSTADNRSRIEESFELSRRRPAGNSHREIPPYFVAALEEMSARGAVRQAYDLAMDFATGSNAEFTARRSAHQTMMYIVFRMRLRELGYTWLSGILDRSPDEAERWFLGPATLPALATAPFATRFAGDLAAALSRQEPDTLAERSGVRLAAEVLFKQSYPSTPDTPNDNMLAKAGAWFEAKADWQGALLAHISLAMLRAKQNKRQELDEELARCWEFYANLDYLPPRERLDALVNSAAPVPQGSPAASNSLDAIEEFWRPWLVRLLFCTVRSREFELPGPATRAANAILPMFRGSTKDLEGILAVRRGPLARFLKSRPWIVIGITLEVLLGLGFLGLIAWGVIAMVGKAGQVVGQKDSGIPILIFFFLVLLFGLFRLFLSRMELTMRVEPLKTIAYRNYPLQWPSRVIYGIDLSRVGSLASSLLGWLPLGGLLSLFFSWAPVEERLKKLEGSEDLKETSADLYTEAAKIFPPHAEGLRRLGRFFGRSLLLVRLQLDLTNCSAPWEAIVTLASPAPQPISDGPLVFRRTLQAAPEFPQNRWKAPVAVVTIAPGLREFDLVSRSWSALNNRAEFTVARWTASEFLIQHPAADILHVMATPVDTAHGLVLEVRSTTGSERPSASVRQQVLAPAPGGETRYLLSAENLFSSSAPPRLCIVQCPPGFSARRTPADRRNAALLRRFGAELHSRGVAAVVLLPRLTEDLTLAAIGAIAKTILDRPPNVGRKLATTIREVQDLVVKEQSGISALELPFDICLYAPQNLTFDIDLH